MENWRKYLNEVEENEDYIKKLHEIYTSQDKAGKKQALAMAETLNLVDNFLKMPISIELSQPYEFIVEDIVHEKWIPKYLIQRILDGDFAKQSRFIETSAKDYISKKFYKNWKKHLEEQNLVEKLVLKPGKDGWDKYAELVGKAYLSAPKFEQRAVPHFQALIPFINKMFKRISSRVNIEFVDYHPYNNAQELRDEVKTTGILKIATIDAEHDIFDEETNAKFRAIHDYMAHIQAIGSRGTEFTLQGELAAYNAHLKTIPQKAIPALFTEVVGQVCANHIQGGEFAEQKICLLDGFDFINIGIVDGYDVINKELVKK